MSGVLVLRPGFLTTVQDRGRFGHRSGGVALCGALDSLGFTLANLLAGNSSDAAVLEITMGGAAFVFTGETRFALTGADTNASIDGEPVAPWSSRRARAGATLELRTPQRGMRSILALAGGIDVPLVLGSRSTDLQAGFGGLEGRALRAGDRLETGVPAHAFGDETFRIKPPQWEFDADTAGVLRAPGFDEWEDAAAAAFWHDSWTVTPQSNRMGCRLQGEALRRKQTGEDVLSHAVFPGVIQVPPSGRPIVLLNDAQTTGGYPEIGVVRTADLWKFAGIAIGSHLRFVESTPSQAREASSEAGRYVRDVETAIASKRLR